MADEREDANSPAGKVSPRMIAGGILALLAVLFIVGNSDEVEVSFIGFSVRTSMWLVLTVTFVVGLAVGTLVLGRSRYKPSKSKRS